MFGFSLFFTSRFDRTLCIDCTWVMWLLTYLTVIWWKDTWNLLPIWHIQQDTLCSHTHTHTHTHTQTQTHTSTHNLLRCSWKDIWTECGAHTHVHALSRHAQTHTHMQQPNSLFCLWQHKVTLYNNTLVWGERGSWLNEVSGNERWPVSLAHKKGQSGAVETGQSPNRRITHSLSYSGMSYEHLKSASSSETDFLNNRHTLSFKIMASL